MGWRTILLRCYQAASWCIHTAKRTYHAVEKNPVTVAALILFGAMGAAAVTVYSGLHGLYPFDTGINYNMGWLIYNRQLPYLDFTMPLTPGSGLLTALGFALFGVTFQSSVFVAAIIAALGYAYILMCLRAVLPNFLAALVAFTLVTGTVPVIGTLYYNHLAILVSLMVAAGLLRILYDGASASVEQHARRLLVVYLLCTLLVFVKLHVGLLYGIVIVAVDILTATLQLRIKFTRALRGTALRLLPSLAALIGFLAWLHFDVAEILANLLRTAEPHFYQTSFYGTLLDVTDMFSMPELTPFTALVGILVLTGALAMGGMLYRASAGLIIFALAILLAQGILAVITAETASLGTGVTVLAILAAGLALARGRATNTPEVRAVALAVFLPVLVMHLGFNLLYTYEMGRKTYDEGSAQFLPIKSRKGVGLEVTQQVPFFQAVRMRAAQKQVMEYCYALADKNPFPDDIFRPRTGDAVSGHRPHAAGALAGMDAFWRQRGQGLYARSGTPLQGVRTGHCCYIPAPRLHGLA